MLHRHATHGEAVARIGWCVTEHRIGVITGEVGAGKTVAIRAALHGHRFFANSSAVGAAAAHLRLGAPGRLRQRGCRGS